MKLLDTLRSLVTGLGGPKDKSVSQLFSLRLVDAAELNAMHRSDWLARKIVDIIPNDMTRGWRDWQAEQDQIEKIEAVEKAPQINVQVKLNEALRKARLLGGAGLYLGMKDKASDQPLVIDRVKLGDLQYVHVLTRLEVTTGPIVRDITSEWFGQPSYYEINAGGTENLAPVRIHPSRFIRLVGADILDATQQVGNEGWGDSILQVVYDAIQNASSAQQHTAALIPEAKTDVIYIPQLSQFLQNSQTTKQLTDRFTYANTIKSMFNMVLLEGTGGTGPNDGGERWEQKQISFAQLPELMRQYLQIASAAADIPITRMLGESPGGLNSTGQGDLKNYHDNIAAKQTNDLSPAINRLDEVVIRSALGSRPAGIYYTWAPLEQMSEKERAEIFKTKVDAARTIVGTGGTSQPMMPVEVVSEALANELIEDGSLAGLDAAIAKYGLSVEEPAEGEEEAALTQQETADAAPQTLYVRRDVLNSDEIVRWAKAQGFETTLPAADLHVTIAFSRTPVDWMTIPEAWSFGDKNGNLTIPAGGPRMMERFGDATVLLFASSELSWRHMAIREAGASWDHPEYQPHITISYAAGALDLSKVKPYRGPIELGPEIFEEVEEDRKAVAEKAG